MNINDNNIHKDFDSETKETNRSSEKNLMNTLKKENQNIHTCMNVGAIERFNKSIEEYNNRLSKLENDFRNYFEFSVAVAHSTKCIKQEVNTMNQ